MDLFLGSFCLIRAKEFNASKIDIISPNPQEGDTMYARDKFMRDKNCE
jgi:hypothetical protein